MNIESMSIRELKHWIECLECAIEEYDVDIVFERARNLFENS